MSYVFEEGAGPVYPVIAKYGCSATFSEGYCAERQAGANLVQRTTGAGNIIFGVVHSGDMMANGSYRAVSGSIGVARNGVVWVSSATTQSWEMGQPVFQDAIGQARDVSSSACMIGFYVCNKDGNIEDKTTSASGELIGVDLRLNGKFSLT